MSDKLTLCDVCAYYVEEHENVFADTAKWYAMMKKVSEDLPYEYHEVLEQILTDWRTHALPTCDPLAID